MEKRKVPRGRSRPAGESDDFGAAGADGRWPAEPGACRYPAPEGNTLGFGLPIDRNDAFGEEIRLGDWLEFDPIVWTCPMTFQVYVKDGEICHPGTASDLTEHCRVISRAPKRGVHIVKEEIEPCPSCGRKAITEPCRNPQFVAVRCGACAMKGPIASHEDGAISKWNALPRRSDRGEDH
jgi:hypothetical protein